MLRDSPNPVVKNTQTTVISGRKWKAKKSIEDAESTLKMQEIVGVVACRKAGL